MDFPLQPPAFPSAPPVVLVMLKAPRTGTVKTRLGAQIGFEAATHIYRQLAERQLAAVPEQWTTEIHFAPLDAAEEMRAWLGESCPLYPQSNGDLGQRLTHAVAAAFGRGASAAIVVGGDCPDLDTDYLKCAVAALQNSEVVLGPARDGGYTLIALRRPEPRLFADIPWSTEAVLECTLARTAEQGLSHTLLAPKEDVDDFDSLRRFIANSDAANSLRPLPAAVSVPTNEKLDCIAIMQLPVAPLTESPSLTVVIPTLDEATAIRQTVTATSRCLPHARLMVVDGGSGDGTCALAKTAGASVVMAGRGRGPQCHAGAQAATTEWILFLHADTVLPDNAAEVIRRFVVAHPAAQIATFRLSFDQPGLFLRLCCWFTRFDSVFTRFGDQGILIRRSFYHELGGFPAWPLFEDVALLQRARRRARIYSLPAAVTTSVRRFQANGHFRQQWLNARLLLRYLCGASPHVLADDYRKARQIRSAKAAHAALNNHCIFCQPQEHPAEMKPDDRNGKLPVAERPFRVLLIAGSDRRQYNCPGVDSKARTLMLRMAERLPPDWEIDVEDLGNVFGRARIQSCNACVSTSMALCVWPCNCYEKNNKKEPDLMWDLDLYARLDLADAWAIVSPVNWYGPTSNLKLMFDRLVCMNGGNPREALIKHKDPELAMKLERSAQWEKLSLNHLEGRTAAFFCYGDAGGDELDANGRPKILRHKEWFDPRHEPFENNRDSYAPLVWQCRYGGIEVPDALWRYAEFGVGEKYSDNQAEHLPRRTQVLAEFDLWTDAFAKYVAAKGKATPGRYRAFGYVPPAHRLDDLRLGWRDVRMRLGVPRAGSSPKKQQDAGLNQDRTLHPKAWARAPKRTK